MLDVADSNSARRTTTPRIPILAEEPHSNSGQSRFDPERGDHVRLVKWPATVVLNTTALRGISVRIGGRTLSGSGGNGRRS